MFNKGTWINPEPLPTPELIFKPMEITRTQKLSHMIGECLRTGIEIPDEWAKEYNGLIKEPKADIDINIDGESLCKRACKELDKQNKRAGVRV